METVAQTRKIKRVLCISPKGAQVLKDAGGSLRSWDVCTVGSLPDAEKVLHEQRFLVGLLIDCVGYFAPADLDEFLGRQGGTQWIAVIDKKIIIGFREHIVNNTLSNYTLQEWIEKRRVKFFFADYSHIYEALGNAASLLDEIT